MEVSSGRATSRRASRVRGLLAASALALFAAAAAPGAAAAQDGPPERPDTRQVMFVGNNWEGTADVIDARTFERLGRLNVIPDKEERLEEIHSSPDKLAFFLLIRQFVGEGNDQYVDDMFTTHDGELVAVSRPSFADVVGISLSTHEIVWRFPMEGYRSDHMAVSPDGTRLLVSDSTANKVHELDILTGAKTGEFPTGDSPHENQYSKDGTRIFNASIGRVYTPTDRSELGPVRDASKGERYFQVVDAESLDILTRVDMGQKLEEAGYPEMDSAVRPMALSPDERLAYLQISFHHGFVEYDLDQQRVTRVVDLPISEEAQNTPREEYLLDSAHHGIAMNPEGTKLCVAGTMSDYAAIVTRATMQPTVFPVGEKPYWSTNGLGGGTCWVSFSGDDNVGVFDYATEQQIATIPVGDHPQRVRRGAIQTAYVPGLPQP
jgi:YVTN family beta-propeller protein